MTYTIALDGSIIRDLGNGSYVHLPPTDNGTATWEEYKEWLDAGNQPEVETPVVKPDYRAFWSTLIGTDLYTTIREQSSTSLPMNTVVTEFIALLTDAKNGFAIEEAIQQSLLLILATGTFTTAHLSELEAALELSHLDHIYSLDPLAP